MEPLVSVVVPTHNRPEMLAEALASVRAQTFTDYEVIVISNGESANARRASREAAAGCVFLELNEGNLPAARNHGIAHANGEWIAFLDDDDLWLPTKLERQIAEAKRTGADMVACDSIQFYLDGREIVHQPRVPDGWSYVKAICHHRWGVPPSTVMVRKAVLDEVSGFDPEQRVGEDGDLHRRISWRHTIHQMDEVLTRYRIGHTSLSQNRREANRYELRYYVKMLRDTPPDLRWAVPSAASLMRRWLLRVVLPKWIRHPRKQLLRR